MLSMPTVRQVLEIAISKELESQRLYDDLSSRVREEAAAEAFQDLVRQERGHQVVLERYMRGELVEGALSPAQTVDYKIAEHFSRPDIGSTIRLADAFLVAAHREKVSHEFYLGLAAIHPDGEVRRLLDGLAAQELVHKHRVEFLYTQVAFPQTDGG